MRTLRTACISFVVAVLVMSAPTIAQSFRPQGSGGFSSALACLIAGGTSCTMTGSVIMNTGAAADATITETGIDRASGSNTSFNIQNSGAGTMDLQLDGSSVCTAAAACLKVGDADCTMTGGGSIRSTSNTNLPLTAQGSGSIVLQSGSDQIILNRATAAAVGMLSTASGNMDFASGDFGSNRGFVRVGTTGGGYGVIAGNVSDVSASLVVFAARDVATSSPVDLFDVWGGGVQQSGKHQAVTCSAGAATVDPTSKYVDINPGGVACVVTLSDSSAPGPGFEVIFTVVSSSGVGVVTFPDVANVHDGPTLCTTTGLTLGGTYMVTFADESNDRYEGVACIQNA